jgi:ribonuclease HI
MRKDMENMNENMYSTRIWKMFFDGALYCEGAGAGVLFLAPKNDFVIPFSYRLQWDIDYTNNVCEYEALVLGLEASRKLNIKNLEVYGDAELIVKQINRQLPGQAPKIKILQKLHLGPYGKTIFISKGTFHPPG